MKRLITLLYISLLIPYFSLSQGSSCATAIPIPLDGVLRNYTISSSTGSNLVCTSSGTTSITYFTITSNSSAESMLLDITGPGGQPVEVGFYAGVTCNNGAFEPSSSICLYDGTGLWAPDAVSFSISPNTTYTLRIKTQTTGTIQIAGQHHTPLNNDCLNATEIGMILTYDQNANHMPGTGITAAELCAASLENTAFYYYIVDSDGDSGVSFENMTCDNNYGNNMASLGYHFGLFTGNCSSLTSIACHTGPPVNVQLNAGYLTAGTKVYVAMDGVSGSNCHYGVRAINSIVLSANLKYFTAWKAPEGNILKWISLKENGNKDFEVQRSVDGVNYRTIAQLAGQINSSSEKNYQYTDVSAPDHCLYRLRMESVSGKVTYSNVIRMSRNYDLNAKVLFCNKVTDDIDLRIIDFHLDKLILKIIDNSGRILRTQNIKISSGENYLKVNTSSISAGMYHLILTGDNYNKAFPFVKS
jgi:hypothetical protein